MSFIEKNKAWLLPLLALGVLGVGYMNYRSFTGESAAPDGAAPQETTPLEEAAPPAEAAAPTPEPSPQTEEPNEASAESGNLWADLESFAVVPGELGQEGPLRDRARVALDPGLTQEPLLLLDKPTHSSLQPIRPKSVGGSGPDLATPPQLDFLIHTPQGAFAWFEGRGYRVGENLGDSGYVVNRIGATSVELMGPGGAVLEYTNPLHSPRKTTSDTAEAP